MKKYAIIGALYFDSINGNTYHNTKIIDTETGATYYTGYKYGYGNAWEHSADDYIERVLGVKDFSLIKCGAFRLNKKQVKNGNF